VVLGARGFVASALAGHLSEAGLPVHAVSSSDLDLTLPAAEGRLAELLRPTDALVFTSALTPDRGKDIATMMRNLEMAQHVCAALTRRPCAHVVYIGSDAVYDDAANPVRETSCCQPSTFHGVMHLARERMLIETLRGAKTPLAMLRPSLLYGPGDTHNGYGPNRFLRLAAEGKPITLFGEGEEQRDHVYIGDVTRLVERILLSRSEGVLNVATGRSWSFRDVAARATNAAGRAVTVSGTPRANPITHRHFDITAAIAAFPDFRYTELDAGLARFAASLAAA
jgi:nucleoside-diphosphate-sugar epimerase